MFTCFDLSSWVCDVLGSEDQARVYIAEIVSAVSHLHKSGIVHRDLKPENILMDADGHVMTVPIDSYTFSGTCMKVMKNPFSF